MKLNVTHCKLSQEINALIVNFNINDELNKLSNSHVDLVDEKISSTTNITRTSKSSNFIEIEQLMTIDINNDKDNLFEQFRVQFEFNKFIKMMKIRKVTYFEEINCRTDNFVVIVESNEENKQR